MIPAMAKRKSRKQSLQIANVQAALAESRVDDAWAEAQRLLAMRIKDVSLLNIAGIAAFRSGDVQAAIDLLTDAVARRPGDPEIRMNLANVLAGAGKTNEALSSYQAAHEASERFAEPAYNAGVMLSDRGSYTDARVWFSAALERDPEHVQAAIGKSEAERHLGDFDAARATLSVLLALEPENPAAHTNLSAIAMETGDVDAAYASAARAIECDPGMAAAHYNLGVAAQAKSDHQEALGHYKKSLALDQGNAAAALNLGETYLELGEEGEAHAAFARALKIDPTFSKAAINLADIELASGNGDRALALIDDFLAGTPGQPAALAFKAIVLRDLGRNEQAEVIDDLDRFVRPVFIDAPDGFEDIQAFNEAMAAHVLSHPTLTVSPTAHATRSGQHSGELLSEPLGPFDAFRDIIVDAFKDYRRAFAGEPSHPYLDRCPEKFEVSVWGVVMHEAGHQVSHIHPAAWLSGVYYVDLPESIDQSDATHAGWIEFGRFPNDIHAHHEPETRLIRPEMGKMLLFPSHFYHRTLPLRGDQQRISVAFDIVAANIDAGL